MFAKTSIFVKLKNYNLDDDEKNYEKVFFDSTDIRFLNIFLLLHARPLNLRFSVRVERQAEDLAPSRNDKMQNANDIIGAVLKNQI